MLSKILRVIAALLAMVLLTILLSSCGHSTVDNPNGHDKRFKILETHYDFTVYVDMETGVEWVYGGRTFLPIIDSYGDPYIYPAFDAREDRPNGT